MLSDRTLGAEAVLSAMCGKLSHRWCVTAFGAHDKSCARASALPAECAASTRRAVRIARVQLALRRPPFGMRSRRRHTRRSVCRGVSEAEALECGRRADRSGSACAPSTAPYRVKSAQILMQIRNCSLMCLCRHCERAIPYRSRIRCGARGRRCCCCYWNCSIDTAPGIEKSTRLSEDQST